MIPIGTYGYAIFDPTYRANFHTYRSNLPIVKENEQYLLLFCDRLFVCID